MTRKSDPIMRNEIVTSYSILLMNACVCRVTRFDIGADDTRQPIAANVVTCRELLADSCMECMLHDAQLVNPFYRSALTRDQINNSNNRTHTMKRYTSSGWPRSVARAQSSL